MADEGSCTGLAMPFPADIRGRAVDRFVQPGPSPRYCDGSMPIEPPKQRPLRQNVAEHVLGHDHRPSGGPVSAHGRRIDQDVLQGDVDVLLAISVAI